ncbi:MAG: AAA family ATPase [Candidatus Lokiarchaeota archaeon]|nr:AAA family ATPase [Candidatus Lokiarchaeota archaeon]
MEEFEEIRKLPNGLKFYKTDLHAHYPIEIKNESESFEDGVTTQDVVDKFIENNYDLIAIGDHNSIRAIQKIKEFKDGNPDLLKRIRILPSIELNLKENYHLVLIFPETFTEDQIRDLLVGFGLESPPEGEYDEEETLHYFENTKSVSVKNIDKILEKCKKAGVTVIAPHSNKSKGFDNLNSRDRKKIIKEDLLTILDCETLPEFYSVSNKALEQRIAHVRCSDAHKISEIGSQATWIKMDLPRYKSLQQIIFEPKLRVLREEPISKVKFKIIGLSIDGGMLRDVGIHFNENYNSIIGGTGSGKSSIIDIFKYIFGSFGLNNKFKKITLNRLRDIHHGGTQFILYCQKNEDIFKIVREIPVMKRELKSKDIEGIIASFPGCEIYKLIADQFNKISENINEIFQPVIFGQNEILDYSFDSEDLVNIFDLKVKDKIYQEYMLFYEDIKKRIKIIDDLARKNDVLEELDSQIEDINKTVEEQNRLLEDIKKKFPDSDIYNKERQIYRGLLDKLNKNEIIISSFMKELSPDIEVINLEEVKNKDLFEQVNESISHILEIFKDFENKTDLFKNLKKVIENIYTDELKIIYEDYDSKLKEYCKENDIQNNIAINDYINSQENEKTSLILEKKTIQRELEKLKEKKILLFEDIDKWYEQKRSLFEIWGKYASDFTSQMKGLTKIEIELEINFEEYSDILKELELSQTQIKKVVNLIKPEEFAKLYLKDREEVKAKLSELNFKDTTNDKILKNFSESIQLKCKLCLEKPSVKFFLKKNEKFSSIEELSTGERCATLLNFVFCQADEPVIIDQPEDNIDYNYIRTTINILKEQKSARQFIIVSHNQNLPVLADADLILTMNNVDDKKIEIQNRGSLESEEIHKSILNLEGGRDAFKLRVKKYQLIEI